MQVSSNNNWYVLGAFLFFFGCSNATTASNENNDTADGSTNEGDSVCESGEQKCDQNVAKKCNEDGQWALEDCEEKGLVCIEDNKIVDCVKTDSSSDDKSEDTQNEKGTDSQPFSQGDDERDVDHGSDTQNDSEVLDTGYDTGYDTDVWDIAEESICDSDDLDCFGSCWTCGLEEVCTEQVSACAQDNESESGCDDYDDCVMDECCGDSGCLQGDEWLACTSDCRDKLNTTPKALGLWHALSKCIVCEACPKSCAGEHLENFHICVDESKINKEETPCFKTDVRPGQVACYSWAGWGGPCTPWVQKCYNDADCWKLQQCFDKSWNEPEWSDAQDDCLKDVNEQVVDDFYTQIQCIYCQACDASCMAGSDFAKCGQYSSLF